MTRWWGAVLQRLLPAELQFLAPVLRGAQGPHDDPICHCAGGRWSTPDQDLTEVDLQIDDGRRQRNLGELGPVDAEGEMTRPGEFLAERSDPLIDGGTDRQVVEEQEVPPVEPRVRRCPHHQVVSVVDDRRSGQSADHEVGTVRQGTDLHLPHCRFPAIGRPGRDLRSAHVDAVHRRLLHRARGEPAPGLRSPHVDPVGFRGPQLGPEPGGTGGDRGHRRRSGRYLLAVGARRFRGHLSEKRRENLAAASDALLKKRASLIATLVFFAISPLPSAQLFIAAGLLEMDLVPLTLAFLAGRLVSYSIYLSAASLAQRHFGDVLGRIFGSPWSIAVQLILLTAVSVLPFINWKDILERRAAKRGNGPTDTTA